MWPKWSLQRGKLVLVTKERILNRQRSREEMKKNSVNFYSKGFHFQFASGSDGSPPSSGFLTVSALCWPNILLQSDYRSCACQCIVVQFLNAPDPIAHEQLDSVRRSLLITLFRQRHPKCFFTHKQKQGKKNKYERKDIREWLLQEKASRGQRVVHYAENCALSVTVESNLTSRG